ncbi:hypothetical protein L596_021735 [Steinernema carpocapsae]|uniref:Uncharacterized protein n=1 Tax=Steinernema carpocapsae TaxID=34508 RepID=A0A4V6A008_STECR|nr:hypothetical protein L596_021735 [Steinernema carpocapsae]
MSAATRITLYCLNAIATILMLCGAVFYVREVLTMTDYVRPADEFEYLQKASEIDEEFSDKFSYELFHGGKIRHIQNTQIGLQKSMAKNSDLDERILLTVDWIKSEQEGSVSSKIENLTFMALEAIGSKWTQELQQSLIVYLESEHVTRIEKLRIFNHVLSDGELAYGIVKNLVPGYLHDQIAQWWSNYKASHVPGINETCLQPFPDSYRLLDLYDDVLVGNNTEKCRKKVPEQIYHYDVYQEHLWWTYGKAAMLFLGALCFALIALFCCRFDSNL